MLKKGLGKGLSALIPEVPATNDSPTLEVEVEKIAPNPFQPRRSFDEATMEELASSIQEKGIIQPLLVRRQNGGYELIAGERRLRAALRAGLDKVPVVVREATDNEALQLALIENIQREDLNPIEEATAYQRLQEEFRWSQEEVASRVGMSRPAVANSIRLLLLPKEVQQDVASGKLAAGQARALLGLQREALILSAAREAIAKGLSTRETERLVQKLKAGPRRARGTSSIDADLRSLVERLQRSLGTKVRIIQRAKSARGRIEIDYYSSIDLDRIVQAMTQHP
ncbi:MAG TPA: ParB/RepB/Spo0J family partition protein [Candidatus Binatia bacterium]|jgi:ParB family chromosome partitioning protein|nr:ParB/RepB/Spo0J family partition protein [Candidatus Binatia bacterium]